MKILETELSSKIDFITDECGNAIDYRILSEKLSITFIRDMNVETIIDVLEEVIILYKEREVR